MRAGLRTRVPCYACSVPLQTVRAATAANSVRFYAKAKEDSSAFMTSLKGEKGNDGEIKFTLERDFVLFEVDGEGPTKEVITNKDELLGVYTEMQTIRTVELISNEMYKNALIKGFLHLYNGQEAIASGMELGLTKQDAIITAYRDHGHAISRGDTPIKVIAELVGKKGGMSLGKGGSMHMYKTETNYYGGNGIVGAQIPVGTGVALAQKMNGKGKNGNCTVALMGDGASNQGQVFEAFNIAKLWNLPVLYVIENNGYGMGTEVARAAANTEFYKRGAMANIPGILCDGMDVLAMKSVTQWSKAYSLENGPVLIDADCYRYEGHSMSDPGKSYRTLDEVTHVRKTRDPITQCKLRLVMNDLVSEKEIKALDRSIRKDVEKARDEVLNNMEWPDLKETYTQVLSDDVFVRGVELEKSYNPA